jgi:hypothetical protein
MGILVSDNELVTCAHVVQDALSMSGDNPPEKAELSLCFPFTEGPICSKGLVDKVRWYPPKESPEKLSDIAIICLQEEAPNAVPRAIFRRYAPTLPGDPEVQVYGFQSKSIDSQSDWVSHPTGEIATGKISGELPGGRAQLVGLTVTGAAIKKGYSGAGVYDPKQDAIVGMIVEADRDEQKKIAQFIDTSSLRAAMHLPSRDESADGLPGPIYADVLLKQIYKVAFFVGVLLFSVYPISVFAVMGITGDALRWLKHNPAHNLFCLLLLPLAIALFTTSFDISVIHHILKRSKRSSIASLIGLVAIGIYMAAAGATTKRFAEPFFFKDAVVRAAEDRQYRISLESSTPYEYTPNVFNGWEDFSRRASVVAYISIFVNAIANTFALFYLWYLICLVDATRRGTLRGIRSDGKVPTKVSWALMMSFSLLLSWFPMRIYSEWYASFYTLKHVLQYMSFWTFALLAILVQGAMWRWFSLSLGVRLSQLIYSAVILVICVISVQTDVLLRASRYVLDSLGDVGFALTYSVVIGVLLVLIPMFDPDDYSRE